MRGRGSDNRVRGEGAPIRCACRKDRETRVLQGQGCLDGRRGGSMGAAARVGCVPGDTLPTSARDRKDERPGSGVRPPRAAFAVSSAASSPGGPVLAGPGPAPAPQPSAGPLGSAGSDSNGDSEPAGSRDGTRLGFKNWARGEGAAASSCVPAAGPGGIRARGGRGLGPSGRGCATGFGCRRLLNRPGGLGLWVPGPPFGPGLGRPLPVQVKPAAAR